MGQNLSSSCSPFETLEAAFQQLGRPPAGLSINGRVIGHGLPARQISLVDLRRLLLSASTGYEARDAAIAVLLRRAQTGAQPQVLALAGMLRPGLARRAGPLLAARPGLRDDLEAEILTRLVALIPRLDPALDRLAVRLIYRATQAAYRLARQERRHGSHAELTVEMSEALVEPPTPPAHPDFLLDEAVAQRVISRAEADLISRTRLDGESVKDLAAGSPTAYARLRKRRVRAERRLVAWLLTCRLSQNEARRWV